tara:strand:+ start:319 stop:519 length:201 start_codon:yes stop_codon:yes gene_type:complete
MNQADQSVAVVMSKLRVILMQVMPQYCSVKKIVGSPSLSNTNSKTMQPDRNTQENSRNTIPRQRKM